MTDCVPSNLICMSYQPTKERLYVVACVYLTVGLGVCGPVDHRPEYCGLARNTDTSLYFVPFFLAGLYTMAPVDLSGTWKLVRSENFDEYLKEMSKCNMAIVSYRHSFLYIYVSDLISFVLIDSYPCLLEFSTGGSYLECD